MHATDPPPPRWRRIGLCRNRLGHRRPILIGTSHPDFGSVDHRHSQDLGRLMHLDRSPEPIVVGHPEGGVAERGRLLDQRMRM